MNLKEIHLTTQVQTLTRKVANLESDKNKSTKFSICRKKIGNCNREKGRKDIEAKATIEKLERKLQVASSRINEFETENKQQSKINNEEMYKASPEISTLLREKQDLELKLRVLTKRMNSYKKKSEELKSKAQHILEVFRNMEKERYGILPVKNAARCCKCQDLPVLSSPNHSPVTLNRKPSLIDFSLTSPHKNGFETSVSKIAARTSLVSNKEVESASEFPLERASLQNPPLQQHSHDPTCVVWGPTSESPRERRTSNFGAGNDTAEFGDASDQKEQSEERFGESLEWEKREGDEEGRSEDKENERGNGGLSGDFDGFGKEKVLREENQNKQSSVSLHPNSLTRKLECYLSPVSSNPNSSLVKTLRKPSDNPNELNSTSKNQKRSKITPCYLEKEFNLTTSNFTYKSPSNCDIFNEFKSSDNLEIEFSGSP
ncbi:unnamed protein product [Moneuplotes crassus]|uniref:Uncharacterized protein n=1 Tax=Euplotes crassus TaxID=5936 RepID=A0AAD1TZJ5_EUPCR|nr:unnamed protein product [Moneuplotes crassus]